MSSLQFDPEVSRQIESVYTTPDVIEQRRVVRAALALRAGDRVLDVGVGPGLLAAEMAAEVGPDGRVCGIDISDSMLAIAATRAKVPDGPPIELELASAARIPHGAESFDVVVSTQVFEYLDDVPGALNEIRRVLRPAGRVVLLDTDWGSTVWRSTDDARMARVLTAFEEHLEDPHLPRTLGDSLDKAGFTVTHQQVVPMLNIGYDARTYSAGLIDIVEAFVPGRAKVSELEATAWAEDLRGLGESYFFSLNRYLFVASAL
ncbi:methyltransferase domain-containing protein [Streptomyces sp. SID13031]|uniref:methyltransferase domain-containing protein n=1 Tax=Streptomyces sp. SID13031 TaxID=2706046 RepID=UPI0013C80D6F|nr:methyltransferase domain-containing protein [Streptomyces sp. SID13031]NEA35410.1 methyltransferase domain-containing protein [Streptomyces sp. SID13031]